MKARVWEAVQKLGFPVACTLEAACVAHASPSVLPCN